MRVLIYADTPQARDLRERLRAERHTAILCNPDFFTPADVKEAEVIYFPQAHPKAEEVAALCAMPFAQGHPRAGQTVDLQWIVPPKKAAPAAATGSGRAAATDPKPEA